LKVNKTNEEFFKDGNDKKFNLTHYLGYNCPVMKTGSPLVFMSVIVILFV